MPAILVIEDDAFAAETLEQHLTRAGHAVTVVGRAEDGLAALATDVFDVVLTDIDLPGISGLDLLQKIRGEDAPPIIVITGDGSAATAVRAMRAGAADYIAKPLTAAVLDVVLARVVEVAKIRRQLVRLQQREADVDPDPTLTATSRAMCDALELARRCAASAATAALIVGESGAGKEVMAAFVHRQSARARGPFIRVNVAAIPETMIEAELFGATRGAFTDSKRDRQGFFAAASGGTLLLDEIGELRPELQAKLLRAIETKRFYPVGATREVQSDVRILAATNRDPEEAVKSGRLRTDLFYRLSTMLIRIPSLRARREDVPAMARAMLTQLRRATGRGPSTFDAAALDALTRYPWPGNVRELRNAVERVSILVDADVATVEHLHDFAILATARPSTVPPPERAAVGLPAVRSAERPRELERRDAAPDEEREERAPDTEREAPAPATLKPALAPIATPISTLVVNLGRSQAASDTIAAPPLLPVIPSPPAPATSESSRRPDVIEIPVPADDAKPKPLEEVVRIAVEEVERRYLERIVARAGGNRTRAAEILGVSRSTLWSKLRKYGLDDGQT
jgi:DNA-binding NtrC family response regulator